MADPTQSRSDQALLNQLIFDMYEEPHGKDLIDALDASGVDVILRRGPTDGSLAQNEIFYPRWKEFFSRDQCGNWQFSKKKLYINVDIGRYQALKQRGAKLPPLDQIGLHELAHGYQAIYHPNDFCGEFS